MTKVPTYKTFETERTRIRPTNSEDGEFLVELFNSPKWLKYIGERNVHTKEEGEAYIALKITPQLMKLGFSNSTVIRKSDNVKIGTCGLYDREGLSGVDIGFAFLPQFEKQGYAYEASHRVLQAAFEDFGLEDVSAITIQANMDSQRLLEKLGLRYIEITRIPNDDEDVMLYRITREQWEKQQAL